MKGKVTHAMVGLEVVDLLLEHHDPNVLADELHHVQRVRESRLVAREPGPSISPIFPPDMRT
jgi:hypothetical protein